MGYTRISIMRGCTQWAEDEYETVKVSDPVSLEP